MADSLSPLIALRGSKGLFFKEGKATDDILDGYPKESGSGCKSMAFNSSGSLFAWCNGKSTQVFDIEKRSMLLEVDLPKTSFMCFSPNNNYFATWEVYAVVAGTQATPNLNVWDLRTKQLATSFFQKKQANWEPQWTQDEKVCVRLFNQDLHFYTDNNFDKIISRFQNQKIKSFQVAPGPAPHHLSCFITGSKGQPSFVRIYPIPIKEGQTPLKAQKSFFKADNAEMFWNSNGSGLLILTSTEVDKTGTSYYGEHGLFFLSTTGDGCIVKLGKEGPIYSVGWSPSNKEFCVVYGFIPSKATIYNLKCDPVFDLGNGNRNSLSYSPLGNILLVGGFGNLKGTVETWDVKERKKIAEWQASDTTYLSWSPDNRHIITATTAPRLRTSNGYRIWHYTGSLQYETFLEEGRELWEILWQPLPPSLFPAETKLCTTPVPGIKSAQPQASTKAYRPPSARGQAAKFTLREEEEKKAKETQSMSKQALKNMKQRQAKKAKKEMEKLQENASNLNDKTEDKPPSLPNPAMTFESTGDQEKDRKIRNLLKKLKQINQLKEEQKAGKKLEPTQVEKISREDSILEEIEKLKL